MSDGAKSLNKNRKHFPTSIREAILKNKKYSDYFWRYGTEEETKELLKQKGFL